MWPAIGRKLRGMKEQYKRSGEGGGKQPRERPALFRKFFDVLAMSFPQGV
jgi:hypothetical protein